MRSHARVVVIGGGVVGTAILYHLAMVGVTDSVLLEKDEQRKKRKDSRDRAEQIQADKRADKKIVHQAQPLKEFPDIEMRRYRLDIGYQHNAKPGHIVGAIANEADIDSCYIGNIDIYDDFTLIDLPDGMPGEIFRILKKARVSGRPMNIRAYKDGTQKEKEHRPKKTKAKTKGKAKHGHRKGKRAAVAKRKQKSRIKD